MNVVVVESPAKAKTINKYLGSDYIVLASFGHVRDLPAKDGSVQPDNNFEMTYEVDDSSKKPLSEISKALIGADHLFLATDPDREGEAISWHVVEALRKSKALKKGVDVKRIVFTEITKKAVTEAIQNPREIDMNLVNAQQARRALDYLVGFTLSPVLWRKLPGSKSAGRVQSVALRLICEREHEIEQFISQEYWDIKAELLTNASATVRAKLSYWKGEKLEKFSLTNEAQATEIAEKLKSKSYEVISVEPKQARRFPPPPFTTSTLQQEASRKLGFSAKQTMQMAQKLYEGINIGDETAGLITYMRTDGVQISDDAMVTTRQVINNKYGDKYLPSAPRQYKVKTKNAQEAHEAIRPTNPARTPRDVEKYLDKDMFRLYELIWKRLIASQMENALFDQVAVDIISSDKEAQLHATGSVMKFDGFLTLYQEGKDDEEDEEDTALPPLKEKEALKINKTEPAQHFTEPPPRYTEASLVKKLEELGIGRPSTYASIISVIQDRGYVDLDKKRFIAAPLGRIVSAFLVNFFQKYVEYDFTAKLEDELDEISDGKIEWKQVLKQFWVDFIAKIDESKKLTTTEVIDALDAEMGPFFFKPKADGSEPRACPSCADGRLGIKLGKFGAFIGCSNYPECNYTRPMAVAKEGEEADAANEAMKPKVLGTDPATELEIMLKKGPYGFYVERPAKPKPKRVSLPKAILPELVTLEIALSLLSLPREVGAHPESGKMITADIGRFGPYLKHDGKFTSIPVGDDVLVVGINRAIDIMANSAKKGGRVAVAPLRTLGKLPGTEDDINILSGRYGPYIKVGKNNVAIPKSLNHETITLEEAIELVNNKPASTGKKKTTRKKK